MDNEALVEAMAESAHEAWREAQREQGVISRKAVWGEEFMVPFAELSERGKEFDRVIMRGILKAFGEQRYLVLPDPVRDERVKIMDLDEFCDVGFLQEANRQFFHPHGLALEVFAEGDKSHRGPVLYISGVWDDRDDPLGMAFGDGVIDPEKARRVEEELSRHIEARVVMFGDPIQPVPED